MLFLWSSRIVSRNENSRLPTLIIIDLYTTSAGQLHHRENHGERTRVDSKDHGRANGLGHRNGALSGSDAYNGQTTTTTTTSTKTACSLSANDLRWTLRIFRSSSSFCVFLVGNPNSRHVIFIVLGQRSKKDTESFVFLPLSLFLSPLSLFTCVI